MSLQIPLPCEAWELQEKDEKSPVGRNTQGGKTMGNEGGEVKGGER